jgi:hypothetical protein
MNCYIHLEREAEWTCTACGEPICPECKVVLQNKIYCNPCAEKMYLAALSRKETSWFEKHLNLTLIAAFLLSELVALTIMIILAPYTDAGLPPETLTTPSWLYGSSAGYLVLFPVAGWVIRKKARNRWNVLWLLMPFGFIMLLLLSNMSKAPPNNSRNPRIS